MIAYDSRGVPQTVTSQSELDRIEKCLIGILGMDDDPAKYWTRTAEETGSLALLQAECIDLISSMELEKLQKAKQLIKPYQSNTQIEMSERDVLLLQAIAKWVDREFEQSHQALTHILNKHPKDILSLFACHMLEFNMGWTVQMKDTIESILPAWTESDTLYGYLKGIEAFCLEENGFYEEAFQAAEEALRLNARDIYAIHAVCHCLYETGQFEKGIVWMEEIMPHWQDNKFMRIHVWWHYALFKLYQLELTQVKEIYDTQIRKKNNPTGLEDLDASSLLWRLTLIGGDESSAWKELLECWDDYVAESAYWFNDLHALFVLFANDQTEKANHLIRYSIDHNCNEPIGDIVKHAFEGLRLFSEGEYRQASTTIQNILRPHAAFGGSNAQRDILEMTAIEAALRANDMEQAEFLIRNGRCFKYESPLKDVYLSRLTKLTIQ